MSDYLDQWQVIAASDTYAGLDDAQKQKLQSRYLKRVVLPKLDKSDLDLEQRQQARDKVILKFASDNGVSDDDLPGFMREMRNKSGGQALNSKEHRESNPLVRGAKRAYENTRQFVEGQIAGALDLPDLLSRKTREYDAIVEKSKRGAKLSADERRILNDGLDDAGSRLIAHALDGLGITPTLAGVADHIRQRTTDRAKTNDSAHSIAVSGKQLRDATERDGDIIGGLSQVYRDPALAGDAVTQGTASIGALLIGRGAGSRVGATVGQGAAARAGLTGEAAVARAAQSASGGANAASLATGAQMAASEGVNDIRNFEQETGKQVSGQDVADSLESKVLAGAALEQIGLDGVLGKLAGRSVAKKAIAGGTGEATTEVAQQVASNAATKATYNPDQSLTEGAVQSAIGGFGAGAPVSALHGYIERKYGDPAASQMSQEATDPEQRINELGQAFAEAQQLHGHAVSSGDMEMASSILGEMRAMREEAVSLRAAAHDGQADTLNNLFAKHFPESAAPEQSPTMADMPDISSMLGGLSDAYAPTPSPAKRSAPSSVGGIDVSLADQLAGLSDQYRQNSDLIPTRTPRHTVEPSQTPDALIAHLRALRNQYSNPEAVESVAPISTGNGLDEMPDIGRMLRGESDDADTGGTVAAQGPAYVGHADSHKRSVIDGLLADGVPDEAAKKIASRKQFSAPIDATTGLFEGRRENDQGVTDAESAIGRAIDHVKSTGDRAFYVSADIANLGGLNSYFKNVASKANPHYRALADIVSRELAKTGATVDGFRTGGDEFGAIVVGGNEAAIQKALDNARLSVRGYVKANGLADFEHPKHKDDASKRGLGLHLGYARISGAMSAKDAMAYADLNMDASKKGGDHVGREQTAQADGSVRDAGSGQDQADPDGARGELSTGSGAPKASPGKPVAARATGGQSPVNPATDDLLAAIAKSNGLDRAEAVSQGIDPAELNKRSGVMWVFRRNGGKTFDQMAETLVQYGYPVTDQSGNYSPSALLDSLLSALSGKRIMTPQGYEYAAILEDQRRALAEGDVHAVEALMPPGVPSYMSPSDAILDDMIARALERGFTTGQIATVLSPEMSAEQLAEALTELLDGDPNEHEGQTQNARKSLAKAGSAETAGAMRRSGGADAPGEGEVPGFAGESGQDFGDLTDDEIEQVLFDGKTVEQVRADRNDLLSSHTEQDIRDREQAQRQHEADAARIAAEADRRAKADTERDQFSLTGSDRASDANPGQGDLLSPRAGKPSVTDIAGRLDAVKQVLSCLMS